MFGGTHHSETRSDSVLILHIHHLLIDDIVHPFIYTSAPSTLRTISVLGSRQQGVLSRDRSWAGRDRVRYILNVRNGIDNVSSPNVFP
jgi:hypothetical protein